MTVTVDGDPLTSRSNSGSLSRIVSGRSPTPLTSLKTTVIDVPTVAELVTAPLSGLARSAVGKRTGAVVAVAAKAVSGVPLGNRSKLSTLKLLSRKPVTDEMVKDAKPLSRAISVPLIDTATDAGLKKMSRSPLGARVRPRLPVMAKMPATEIETPVAMNE